MNGYLADYLQRNGRLKSTRDRIEVLCHALSPLRCLELNLYHHYSPNEASLAQEHQNTELFDFVLNAVQPRVLIVHGNTPARHLGRVLGVTLAKDEFTAATYLSTPVEVFFAQRHFAYVSRDYVTTIAALIKDRLRLMRESHR